MAKITTTNQKKNTTMPGMAYPATVLALATGPSYPVPPDLSRYRPLTAHERDMIITPASVCALSLPL
jgi:hypothetical protein